jgi:transposase
VLHLKTARAWAIKESLRDLWSYRRRGWAMRHWTRWYFWATHSRLQPVIDAANTIRRHLRNVMTYFAHRITNAQRRERGPELEHPNHQEDGLRLPEPRAL